jgi:DNA invertase Pin-like site-specific DNA recombinase
MRIGYARVSTIDQNLDLQIDALNDADCEKIFTDKASGSVADRPELDKLKAMLRKGDTLVIWKLDRLSRSLKDLMSWMEYLEAEGVELLSLQDSINTGTPTGKFIFHVFGALGQLERDIIRERTMAGLSAARARGRFGGRPPKLDDKQIDRIKHLYTQKEMTIQELCDAFNISKGTLYKYVKAKK